LVYRILVRHHERTLYLVWSPEQGPKQNTPAWGQPSGGGETGSARGDSATLTPCTLRTRPGPWARTHNCEVKTMTSPSIVKPGGMVAGAFTAPDPFPAATQDLDELLEEVASVLQLTETQYSLAKRHYTAVTDWLSADGSPLAVYEPDLYPQGSMALLTTVRPWKTIEYDLDIICQLQSTSWGPELVYDAVYERLYASELYRPKIERLKRCVRLNYEHDFHLDIIPAEPDTSRGGTCIFIPDRVGTGWQWKASNPRGYVTWFHGRAKTTDVFKARNIAPMPPRTTLANNSVLATVVQLIKRYRDVQFRGSDLSPRSVILTTLAGHAYQGTQSTSLALKEVADGLAAAVRLAAPNRVVVQNPTNPAERFCDKFTDASYKAFTDFVFRLEVDVNMLLSTRGGLRDVSPRLDGLFGREPVQKAFVEYGRRFGTAKEARTLVAGSATGIAIATNVGTESVSRDTRAAPVSRPVPSHRFFGAD
jgi:hypothetical protein